MRETLRLIQLSRYKNAGLTGKDLFEFMRGEGYYSSYAQFQADLNTLAKRKNTLPKAIV